MKYGVVVLLELGHMFSCMGPFCYWRLFGLLGEDVTAWLNQASQEYGNAVIRHLKWSLGA